MKVLLVGDFLPESVLLDSLALRLAGPDVQVDGLGVLAALFRRYNDHTETPIPLRPRLLSRLPKFKTLVKVLNVRRFLARGGPGLEAPYDICNIHFAWYGNAFLLPHLRALAGKIILSVWGSDFYYHRSLYRPFQKRLFEDADVLTFANEYTRDDFNRYYADRYARKCEIVRFGIRILDNIRDLEKTESPAVSRRKLGIPEDAFVITCGNNANLNNQICRVIDSLLKVRDLLPPRARLLFPMTYGKEKSKAIASVQARLQGQNIPFTIFHEFLDDLDVARIRRATDIMIHLPRWDQFSGAMQEHLFAGNLVITGAWLPYRKFEENGVFMKLCENLDQFPAVLADSLKSLSQFRSLGAGNKDIIWRLSSWEANTPLWKNLYRKTLGGDAGK